MTTRFVDHLPSGVHASRSAATAVPVGSLYSCTDHGLIYQSDGSTWATWATLGGAGYTDEQVRDVMGTALVAGSNVTITPNDGSDSITIAAAGAGGVTATTGIVNTGTETTTSTTATNLATVGPSATVTVGASGKVLVTVHAVVWNSGVGNGTNVWVDVSGANTVATASPYVVSGVSPSTTAGQSTSGTFLYTGLTAGSTTFTLKYSASAGTGSFARRVVTATAF